jgi:formate-dependent nitrite reductase membrane component NrfD
MRLIAKLLAASALVLTTATRASALVQDAKIEIKTTDSHGAWYTQPVWIVIGIIALALILALIAMAGRRNNTTVAK